MTPAQHASRLSEHCEHSKLVDEKFQRVTLRLDCANCILDVIKAAMEDARIAERERCGYLEVE